MKLVQSLLAAVTLCAISLGSTERLTAQGLGSWSPEVLHPTAPLFAPAGVVWPTSFQSINMAVIPDGMPGETVIVWDKLLNSEINNTTGLPLGLSTNGWRQRFSVGDPETNTWKNYVITIPSMVGTSPVDGDLFCAGHTWLPDGRLFVAGGNSRYNTVVLAAALQTGLPQAYAGLGTPIPTGYLGSKFAGIWNPRAARVAPDYGWTWLPPHAGAAVVSDLCAAWGRTRDGRGRFSG